LLKVTPEQRFGIVVPTLMRNIEGLAKEIDREFDEEGRSLLKRVMMERGTETGRAIKPISTGEDLKSVGAFFSHLTRLFGVGNKYEVRGNEVIVRVQKCPYALENTSRGLCEAVMAFDVGAVEALSPNLTMEIVKTVAAGDTECQLYIRNK
jgi:predicted hydrocarbon binding protein